MAKKSETLRQRDKAQDDFIALKKMRAGEMDPGPKPSEEAVMPMTIRQKIANFFYHYKLAVIIGSFLAVVFIILMVDLIQRPDYDSKVVVFSYDSSYSAFNQQIADYFEQYYTDVNGNGKVQIASIDCSYDKREEGEGKNSKLTQLHSMVSVEADALIYLMDEESIKHFDNLETELFKMENAVMLPDSFYEYIETEGLITPETKLFAVMREVDGTLIEGENAEAIEAARAVIEKLRAEAE